MSERAFKGEALMWGRRTLRRGVLAVACASIVMASSPEGAAAGEFAVASCKADTLNWSTRAFTDFATRGMKIRRACNPEGPGLRGMITANVVRAGRVPRGAVASVRIEAPPGTYFTSFRWAGSARRRDCRYALQLWADGGTADRTPIKNVKANQRCPRPNLAQAAGYKSRTFTVTGATRIVQRVICVGDAKRDYCSARGVNYIQTHEAEVRIADFVPPTAGIIGGTPLARGEWVAGTQPLNYDASDNVGVRVANAIASGKSGGGEQRPCAVAVAEESFADRVPCPNGAGRINVDTLKTLPEGTQALVVQVQDTAGNLADSPPVTARIDNAPPGRVDANVEGGQEWRNGNDFGVVWSNPSEVDRAPIVAARYKLCPVGPGSCSGGEQNGLGISSIGIHVPAPGEWTLSLWRRDAAGNENQDVASVPVTLRYDPEPPQLGFEAPSSTDPTLVAVSVTDKVSGVAGGTIEISLAGSDTWHTLPTTKEGNRLVARIDDIAFPPGGYQLRARAFDQANNEASTDRRLDGEPMALTLPLRIVSSLQAGFAHTRTIHRAIHRHGKRRVVRRRVTVLRPTARTRFGGRARVRGRLVNRHGRGIAGAEVRVLSNSAISSEELIAVLHTAPDGGFRYTASASSSRTLRFAYVGSPLVLPSERAIIMTVPAQSSLRVDRRRVLNGQAVTFHGRLDTQPVPAVGKLLELQVRLSNRWQTFRTSRTDAAGHWSIRYRFRRTRGVQRFHFRARVPPEASYPFAAGGSRPLTVRVKGL